MNLDDLVEALESHGIADHLRHEPLRVIRQRGNVTITPDLTITHNVYYNGTLVEPSFNMKTSIVYNVVMKAENSNYGIYFS